MHTWMEAAIYCEGTFGVYTSMKEGYFICPACGEPILEEDWEDHDWDYCPVCGERWEDE